MVGRLFRWNILLIVVSAAPVYAGEPAEWSPDRPWEIIDRLHCVEATQGAVADERFIYAVSNRSVAKYDRQTHRRIAGSTGDAIHLNSGILHEGSIVLAHSNYPAKPNRSDIKLLDIESMELRVLHDFGETAGSLTWAVPHGDGWWCHFAYYGAENEKSYLADFDADFRQRRRFTFPPEMIESFENRSASGGIWIGDTLLVTGHDREEIYLLKLPQAGSVLERIETIPVPFAGQAFARDPVSGGLVGIDRRKLEIVIAR